MASRRPRETNSARTQVGDSSPAAIYDAAKGSDWQRVLELCATNPNCAGYQGPDGSTALHLACSQKCPDTAVFESLLRTSPDSVLKQESKGMVPLHCACRFQASPDIVRLLMLDHSAPELGLASVSKRDRKGRTPLYYAERGGASLDVVSMLREMDPNGSAVRMDDGSEESEDEAPPPQPEVLRERYHHHDIEVQMDYRSVVGEAPPRTEPVGRVSSFYRSFLESRSHAVDPDETRDSEAKEEIDDSEAKEESDWTQQGELPPEEGGFDNHEILEQFKIMAEHEALLRVKKETGRDLEYDERKGGRSQGVVLVKKNKLLLKTRLPEPKRITFCAGTFAELREPSMPSFRPTPTFCGRTEQMEPEVTPGKLVLGDEEVPMQQRVIQCLGCREKLSCKQKAMMVHCPNCSVDSPAISTSTETEAYNEVDNGF